MKCPDCGKELTIYTNTEPCPAKKHWHGLHPIAVAFNCGSPDLGVLYWDKGDRCPICHTESHR